MRLTFLPAGQAQVDRAGFGRVRIGRAERSLMGLPVTPSHSRQVSGQVADSPVQSEINTVPSARIPA